MNEETLLNYFNNIATAEELALDVKDAEVNTGDNYTSVQVCEIDNGEEFIVIKEHLIRICNDYLSEKLKCSEINTIAFVLISSDYFHWDNETSEGEIIAKVLFDWDTPEINFPLTKGNFQLWKEYLETGIYKLPFL